MQPPWSTLRLQNQAIPQRSEIPNFESESPRKIKNANLQNCGDNCFDNRTASLATRNHVVAPAILLNGCPALGATPNSLTIKAGLRPRIILQESLGFSKQPGIQNEQKNAQKHVQ
jgi:hypothetical protein